MELLDRALSYPTIFVVDKSKATGPAGVAIRRNDHLNRIADRPKVLPDVCFGCAVREIPDE